MIFLVSLFMIIGEDDNQLYDVYFFLDNIKCEGYIVLSSTATDTLVRQTVNCKLLLRTMYIELYVCSKQSIQEIQMEIPGEV